MDHQQLGNRFLHHPPPHDGFVRAHTQVRYVMGSVAEWINHLIPDSPEKERAIDALDDAMKHTNAAIARHHAVDEGIADQVPTFPSNLTYHDFAQEKFGHTVSTLSGNES